ncbi:sigma-70 family RNA polymerase sigma factor [Mucilaginibacter sp.]|jgi:RNA polymerase sigma factor (sigma-70 family)|uniref:RNA polymerase sigma factor n=1 Tax=Mucilaginibacter sp. TaxID=1882438 RepID=UPI002CC1B41A|nr:sigma-70 family RNA polymerase sigma factor [Mucilaginibacter sp.]HTI61314.1 sigma-70 family RNA polymerase sigma factor [Mucilaginibacter sp.]
MQSDLYQLLLKNSDVAYREIYKAHYSVIKQYVLKNSGSEDDAKDLFQEGVIALWDNIHSGKYNHTNETMLHGYFRSICKFKWMEILRAKGKFIEIADDGEMDVIMDGTVLNDMIRREEIDEFMGMFSALADKCRQILSLFYYDKKNMKEISVITGYEISSMRNEKYKCIEKLRTLYLKRTGGRK